MAKMANIDVNDLAKTAVAHITITITGYKKFRIKLVVGISLIRLGIRVIGMKGEVEYKE